MDAIKAILKGEKVTIANYSAINFLRLKMKKLGKKIHQERQIDGSYIACLKTKFSKQDELKRKTVKILVRALETMHPLNEKQAETGLKTIIKFLQLKAQ